MWGSEVVATAVGGLLSDRLLSNRTIKARIKAIVEVPKAIVK